MKFSNALREKRLSDGVTQAVICQQLQVSKQTYIHWEQGRTLPKANRYPLLREYLDVSMGELVQMMIA